MPIGPGSLAVIAIVALIIFGPKSRLNWGKRWETHFVNSKTLLKD